MHLIHTWVLESFACGHKMLYAHLLLFSPISAITIDDVYPFSWTMQQNWTNSTALDQAATCSNAVDVMTYHREKMNEYLCRQFLAQEIVAAEEGSVMQDRSLPPLIQDSGSTGYRDWLARSTTLEDLYRHYEQTPAEDAPIGAQVQLPLAGDYDGEVTGYAMLGNKVSAESSGYGVGSSYGVPSYGGVSKASSEKGMKLNDLFQLALTAIAFLAFGTFIIQIIMCIMGIESKSSTEVMMMVTPEPLQSMSYYKSEENIRSSRSLEDYLGNMAAHATTTLSGFDFIHRDNGLMLRKSLCEANFYSRSLTGTERIWLPLWSFGMSWIGGRHLSHVSDTPFGTLKFLTATLQGMAGVNCSINVI